MIIDLTKVDRIKWYEDELIDTAIYIPKRINRLIKFLSGDEFVQYDDDIYTTEEFYEMFPNYYINEDNTINSNNVLTVYIGESEEYFYFETFEDLLNFKDEIIRNKKLGNMVDIYNNSILVV